jgi:ATP-binding cassette subfamily F protein 3
VLSIENLTYRIGPREILARASARLPAGRRVGLVGRNGTGKTTLLKLILGEMTSDEGEIVRPARWRIGSVAQEAPSGERSLIDTVLSADVERTQLLAKVESETDARELGHLHARLEEIDAYSAPARAASILAGLGFSADEQVRSCREFSGGWRMRVALASVLFAAPDLLLLDEPTNYLDLEGVLWLEDYLRRYRGSVLVVSHDRDLLDTVAEFILHLEAGKLSLYSGNYEAFAEAREARRALNTATAKKQEAARQHMQAFVDRFRYKASKARQAQSRLKMLARLKPPEALIDETIAPIKLPLPTAASPPLLSLERAAVGYLPQIPVLQDISLRLDPDDRVAFLGKNGNGKSTLAKLLAARLEPCGGQVTRARKLVAGYFAQHQIEELNGDLTPVDVLGKMRPQLSLQELRTKLGGFGLSAEKALTKIVSLSGGERARLMLAVASLDSPNLLILDEPTNHLDVDAREQLLAALNDFEGAVVLISHDRRLLEATTDRLLLVADGTVKPFDGDLDDYRSWLLSENRAPASRQANTPKPNTRREAADKRRQLKPLKKRADTAEQELARLHAEIARIDRLVAAPDLFTKNARGAAELLKERAQFAQKLADAENEWLDAHHAYEIALSDDAP